MLRPRIIPVLLLENNGLVKTTRFNNPNYIGDPINAVKIFNDKGVDELILLDISASKEKRKPNFNRIKEIISEAFMPVSYGGGISSLNDIESVIKLGVEKVCINSVAITTPEFIKNAANEFGSSTICISVDVKKNWLGKKYVYSHSGKRKSNFSPIQFSKLAEDYGAGEVLLQSIDNDGTYSGYDLDLIAKVSSHITIPVIACGGAKDEKNLIDAIKAGASASAAGSLFIYNGNNKAVLLNFPNEAWIDNELSQLYISQFEKTIS
jgi:cyclase